MVKHWYHATFEKETCFTLQFSPWWNALWRRSRHHRHIAMDSYFDDLYVVIKCYWTRNIWEIRTRFGVFRHMNFIPEKLIHICVSHAEIWLIWVNNHRPSLFYIQLLIIMIRLIDNEGGIYPNTRVRHVVLIICYHMCGNNFYLFSLTVLVAVKLWDCPLM